jgi:hypothetical protein
MRFRFRSRSYVLSKSVAVGHRRFGGPCCLRLHSENGGSKGNCSVV